MLIKNMNFNISLSNAVSTRKSSKFILISYRDFSYSPIVHLIGNNNSEDNSDVESTEEEPTEEEPTEEESTNDSERDLNHMIHLVNNSTDRVDFGIKYNVTKGLPEYQDRPDDLVNDKNKIMQKDNDEYKSYLSELVSE